MTSPARERRRAVVAVGGNALLRRGEPLEAANQARAARDAARVVARASRTHHLGSGEIQ
jgi:carbamate kinase